MAAFALALATLVVISSFLYRNSQQFRSTAIRVQAIRAVLALNQNLLNHLLDAETGQRGFLLTGRPEYLEPYNAALVKVRAELGELLLANESGGLRSRFVELQFLVADKLSELQKTIDLRRSAGSSAALTIVETNLGKQVMDRIRQISAEIDTEEYANWQAGWHSLESDAQRLRILTLIGASLLVLLLCAGLAVVRRSIAIEERLLIKLAEEKQSAEKTRDLLAATLYSIGDGVITTDSRGDVQRMNAVAERLTGYSEQEARGQRVDAVFRIVNQRTRAVVENPVMRVLRDGMVVGLANHTVLISKSGIDVPIDDSGAPIMGEQGLPSGVVLVFRDVSERYRAEETARRLASIVENSDDAIVGKALDGTVTNWNRAAEQLFGYTAAEMIGTPISRIIPPERVDEMKHILRQVGEGRRLEHLETERLTKDGRRLAISLTVSPICDSDGSVVGASKIARDITGQRELEERLRQSQKMEALGQLAGGVAHDFNNLLTVINGYAILAMQRLSAEDQLRYYFSHIDAAGKRAVALTQQLLAFSRKQILQPRPLSMNGVIRGMEPMLRRMIREDVSFRMALDPQLSAIKADAHQMEQVLMNLVINAADSMPGGGKIQIETKNTFLDENYCSQRPDVHPGKYVMLAVSDTGVGMDAATQERIFEPFFTTKPAGKGTGLGLSTAYGIVKQTGGHIAVYSEVNLGTTLRVYLPASEIPVPQENVKPPITTLQGNETVLLVEDDASLREYATSVLRDLGYRVYEATGGEEALTIGRAQANNIDLLITDVVMPEMSGRDLTDALASIAPRVRVLYMSGYTEAAIVHRGVLDPGIEFLAKPFSPDELATKVREVLATPLRPRSILIVDDDPGILSLLSAVLKDADYQVSTASNGEEAILHCRQDAVDLLITDLVMPEREGIETIRYFRKEVPYVKIIAISGAFEGQILEAADILGAHATLLKPIQPDHLIGVVRSLIG